MPEYKDTDAYIGHHPGPIGTLLEDLRTSIHDELPGATEAMGYGVPTFLNAHGVPVLYLLGVKDHVNFGFLRYDVLSDTKGVLIGSGKPSKHVEISPGREIDKDMLRWFIAQCVHVKRDPN